MEARFHKQVQADLDGILKRYRQISPELGHDFFAEFLAGINKAVENPRFFHFDRSGLRRCDLDRFPYHFLYDIRGGEASEFGCSVTIAAIQVWDSRGSLNDDWRIEPTAVQPDV